MRLGYIQRKQSLASHPRQHSSSMDDAMQYYLFLNHQASKLVQLKALHITAPTPPDSGRQASKETNAMNSTLPSISFQSPCFKLQSAPRLRLRPPRRQETGGAHTRKPGVQDFPLSLYTQHSDQTEMADSTTPTAEVPPYHLHPCQMSSRSSTPPSMRRTAKGWISWLPLIASSRIPHIISHWMSRLFSHLLQHLYFKAQCNYPCMFRLEH